MASPNDNRPDQLTVHSRRDPRWAIPLYLIAGVASQVMLQAAEPPRLAELRQELQAGWEQLRQFEEQSKTYEVAHEVTLAKPGEEGQRTTSRRRVQLDWANGYRLVETREGQHPDRVGVYAHNPDYSFAVAKGTEWVLQAINTDKSKTNPLDRRILAGADRWVLYPLSTTFVGTPLADLLKGEKFHITEAAGAPSGRISVRFEWRAFFLSQVDEWLDFKGEMLVNPDLSYVVEGWKVTYEGDPFINASCHATRERGQAGPVVCRALKQEFPTIKHVWTFENYDTKTFSHDLCYLSQYGLPEPVDVPRRATPIPRYAWLLAAAIGTFLLALLCRRWARSRDARSERAVLHPAPSSGGSSD